MSDEKNGCGAYAGILLTMLFGFIIVLVVTSVVARGFGRGLAEGGFDGRVFSPGHDITQESAGDGANMVVIGDDNALSQTLSPGEPIPTLDDGTSRNPVAGIFAVLLVFGCIAVGGIMLTIMRYGRE